MWSNDENSSLITAVEHQVLRLFPITSTNNNHDFTGNLVDIAGNWGDIAEKLNRSGESMHIIANAVWNCWFNCGI